ncbi:uncharacterized protein [Syngnathus scovelli]|uniref:uncharacterized protein n=1 Tax=Syngnathus scovelli TaxID=161590 RepID=UPI002110A21E|nr:uncharacterized protein LOC125970451 [Syngnathus scovelli]
MLHICLACTVVEVSHYPQTCWGARFPPELPRHRKRMENLWTLHQLPAALTAKVVALKTITKYSQWLLKEDGTVEAGTSHCNTVVALCDGHRVCKFILFPNLASDVSVGGTFRFINFGRGREEGVLLSRHNTSIYVAGRMEVTAHLEEKGTALLYPSSIAKELKDIYHEEGVLFTTDGIVSAIRPIRMVFARGMPIPLGIFFLKKDHREIKVLRWRESNFFQVKVGQRLSMTHMKTACSGGVELHSTENTVIKELEDEAFHVMAFKIKGEHVELVDANNATKDVPLNKWNQRFPDGPNFPPEGFLW